MELVTGVLIGLVAGAVISWFALRRHERGSLEVLRQQINEATSQSMDVVRNELEAKDKEIQKLRALYDAEHENRIRAEEESKSQKEKAEFTEKSKSQMSDSFAVIAQSALKTNTEFLVGQAKEKLDKSLTQSQSELTQKELSIQALVTPLQQRLKEYDDHIREMESSRQAAYGAIKAELQAVSGTNRTLEQETRKLVGALQKSHVGGRWGELQLRNAVELAGMSEFCDFNEQVTIDSANKSWRPDMIVRLPGDREIAVDSKVSMEAYLKYASSETEEERNEALGRHGRHVREHLTDLAKKSYWEKFPKSMDFLIMFLPSEAMYSLALQHDPTIYEEAMRQRVLIATPSNLIALLRSVGLTWRQEKIAKEAIQISDLGRELCDRLVTFATYMNRVGTNLGQAVDAYNSASSSLDSRLLVQARRFKDYGVVPKKEIPDAVFVELQPRLTGTGDQPPETSVANESSEI